jgi:hypothetical protein
VLIWNRPLLPSEVKALFTTSIVPPNGLVAWFANAEGSGTTIHDSVGGKVGKVHGAVWQSGKGTSGYRHRGERRRMLNQFALLLSVGGRAAASRA